MGRTKIGEARLLSVHAGFRGWNCGALGLHRWFSWRCDDGRGGHFLELRWYRSRCNVRSLCSVRLMLIAGSLVVVIVTRLRSSFLRLHGPFSLALASLCVDSYVLIIKAFSVLRKISVDEAKSLNPSSFQHGPTLSRKSWRILVEFWCLEIYQLLMLMLRHEFRANSNNLRLAELSQCKSQNQKLREKITWYFSLYQNLFRIRLWGWSRKSLKHLKAALRNYYCKKFSRSCVGERKMRSQTVHLTFVTDCL
jgi:hypothetical protein